MIDATVRRQDHFFQPIHPKAMFPEDLPLRLTDIVADVRYSWKP